MTVSLEVRRSLAACVAPVAMMAIAVSARAQDTASDASTGLSSIGTLFGQASQIESLTAQQEARLPQAQVVIDLALPPGSLYDSALPPGWASSLTERTLSPDLDALSYIARKLRISVQLLEVSQERAEAAAAMLDPARLERAGRVSDALPQMLAAMELPYRTALAEVYAINFTSEELAEISAFFSTETGSHLARVAVPMDAVRRRVTAEGQSESLSKMQMVLEEALADLPRERGFADLSDTEREQMASLLGFTREEFAGHIANLNPPRPMAPADAVRFRQIEGQ